MLTEKVIRRRWWREKLFNKLMTRSILKELSPFVDPNKTVVDVGGNTGYHSRQFAKLADKVVTYEPVSELFDVLKKNMRDVCSSTELTKFDFRNKAVGDSNKSIDLFIDVRRLSMTSQVPLVESEKRSVPMVALDNENLENVGFIKIDVEGFEIGVLEGAKNLIDNQGPNLMVEIYKPWADKTGQSVRDVFEWFADRPYDCFYYDCVEDSLKPVSSVDHGEEVVNTLHQLHDGDFLFVRK